MKNSSGQVLLLLILLLTAVLVIGLAVISRSIQDVKTSGNIEQSSRAFSAAEAGIEKALVGDFSGVSFTDTGASATVSPSADLPVLPGSGTRQIALEYPPLSKEDFAHVWLADYKSLASPPTNYYAQSSLEIFWGNNSTTDKAAVELTIVSWNGSGYINTKSYFDPDPLRASGSGFTDVSSSCSGGVDGSGGKLADTIYGSGRKFYCSKVVNLPVNPILLRARLLYNANAQPMAFWAVGTCGVSCSLPSQAQILSATGTAGSTQRKIQVFKLNQVVAPYFDFAIFSAGDITK